MINIVLNNHLGIPQNNYKISSNNVVNLIKNSFASQKMGQFIDNMHRISSNLLLIVDDMSGFVEKYSEFYDYQKHPTLYVLTPDVTGEFTDSQTMHKIWFSKYVNNIEKDCITVQRYCDIENMNYQIDESATHDNQDGIILIHPTMTQYLMVNETFKNTKKIVLFGGNVQKVTIDELRSLQSNECDFTTISIDMGSQWDEKLINYSFYGFQNCKTPETNRFYFRNKTFNSNIKQFQNANGEFFKPPKKKQRLHDQS